MGEYINGKREGYGKKYEPNGDYYIGQWKKGLMHGKGTIYNKYGDIEYKGIFVNDIYKGKGYDINFREPKKKRREWKR